MFKIKPIIDKFLKHLQVNPMMPIIIPIMLSHLRENIDIIPIIIEMTLRVRLIDSSSFAKVSDVLRFDILELFFSSSRCTFGFEV